MVAQSLTFASSRKKLRDPLEQVSRRAWKIATDDQLVDQNYRIYGRELFEIPQSAVGWLIGCKWPIESDNESRAAVVARENRSQHPA
jgi:hypothetical protein